MISLAGVAIFVFGNKTDADGVVDAKGVRREFEIAIQHGLTPIPVAATGYMAKQLWDEVVADPAKFYPGMDWIVPLIKGLEARARATPIWCLESLPSSNCSTNDRESSTFVRWHPAHA